MDELEGEDWSEVATDAFIHRLRQLAALKKLDELTKDSKLTDEDCIELGRVVKKGMAESRKKS